ncbi:restriction endonuclease subunit S [Agrobacterium pusense]|uniref:restriction endonuclease subunit S n=1 Tax=Agrobacterium pusense TaxID=648995 RepID=UPI0035A676AC
MNAERLLQLYEQIADAPDAIARLRRFILDLAVRGKLVPQDPADEPASELLKRIAAERDELVRGKVIRKDAPLALYTLRDFPHVIPSSWTWTRVGDTVLFTQYGTSQKSHVSQSGVPVLTMGNIQDGRVIWENEKRIPEASDDLPALYLRTFDLLYNRTNSAELVGKTGIYMGENDARTFASYLIRLRPSLLHSSPIYLNFAMNAPCFRETQIVPLIKKQTGQANVSGSALKNMLIPLPPLAEQHRIVAKVDELMALCDKLEAARTERETKRDRLAAASLARLNTADPETFREDARFALDALPALTTRPDQIKQLRQTILNLAVCGKLVPQDPADEPAEELLMRVARTEREEMRGGRREHRTDGQGCALWPFSKPRFWEWVAFGSLPLTARIGLDRGKSHQGDDLQYGYLKMNNIGNFGGLQLDKLARINAAEEEVLNFSLRSGDLLFNTRNSRELVGKTCVFHDTNGDVVLYNNNILRIRFSSDVSPEWIDTWMRSDYGKYELEKLKSNTTNVCAIYQGKLAEFPCLIPPVAEQHRIVAKVDELMALCDQLETSLTSAAETRKKLLDALLAEALAPVDAEALQEAAE